MCLLVGRRECHFIGFSFWIIFTDPWPSDFRDRGFCALVNFLIYSVIINVLNCMFLYDEYMENTSDDEEYGPLFNFIKTTRHILFWIYGFYVQLIVILIGIVKLYIAIQFSLASLYIPRVCFLTWSLICFYIDTDWIVKTCTYHRIVQAAKIAANTENI